MYSADDVTVSLSTTPKTPHDVTCDATELRVGNTLSLLDFINKLSVLRVGNEVENEVEREIQLFYTHQPPHQYDIYTAYSFIL